MKFSKKQLRVIMESLVRYKNNCTFFSKQFEEHGLLKAHKVHNECVEEIEDIIKVCLKYNLKIPNYFSQTKNELHMTPFWHFSYHKALQFVYIILSFIQICLFTYYFSKSL